MAGEKIDIIINAIDNATASIKKISGEMAAVGSKAVSVG